MTHKNIFLDNSTLYSFIDRSDKNFMQASKLIEQFSLQNKQLFTSIGVVQDVYTALNHQLAESIALDFLQAMNESTIEILYPQKADLAAALRLLKLHKNKQISFKEALMATMMQRKNITQVLTFTYWHNLLGSTSYLASI